MRLKFCALFLLISACAKQTADVNSLHNLLGSNGDINECSGNFAKPSVMPVLQVDSRLNLSPAAKSELQQELILGLSAVPDTVRSLVLVGGATIRITENIAEVCPNESAEDACWKMDDDLAANIYFKPSKAAIRHNVVRMFARAYVYVDSITEELGSLKPKRDEVLNTLITELSEQEKNGIAVLSLKNQAHLFNSVDGREELSRIIFAEALDSYYCSDKTSAQFSIELPSTYVKFLEVVQLLDLPHSKDQFYNGVRQFGALQNTASLTDGISLTSFSATEGGWWNSIMNYRASEESFEGLERMQATSNSRLANVGRRTMSQVPQCAGLPEREYLACLERYRKPFVQAARDLPANVGTAVASDYVEQRTSKVVGNVKGAVTGSVVAKGGTRAVKAYGKYKEVKTVYGAASKIEAARPGFFLQTMV